MEHERPLHPNGQPYRLKYTLDPDAPIPPLQGPSASSEQFLQGQTKACTEDHEKIANPKLDHICRQKPPHLHSKRVSGIFDVSQHGCHDHNSQADPKQDEETAKVFVVAVRVEVRKSRLIIDGVEHAMFRLRSCLFSRRGDRVD
jgi:hypothetical protein